MNPTDLYTLSGQDQRWVQQNLNDASSTSHLASTNGYPARMSDFSANSTSTGSVPFQQSAQQTIQPNAQASSLYAPSIYGQPSSSSVANNNNGNGSTSAPPRTSAPTTSFYSFPYFYSPSTIPISSYSALQGATGPPPTNINGTTSASQAPIPRSSSTSSSSTTIAIDPSLTSYTPSSNHNPYSSYLYTLPSAYSQHMTQSTQYPQPLQTYHQVQPQVISPAMLIRSPANYSGSPPVASSTPMSTPSSLASALVQPPQSYITPFAPTTAKNSPAPTSTPAVAHTAGLFAPSQFAPNAATTTTTTATPSESKPPVIPWKKLLPSIGSLLTPDFLDKSPEQTARSLINLLSSTTWNDIDKGTRMDILTKIRDNAGKEFYQVWASSTIGLDIIRDWLRSTITKEGWEDTVMPLLHVLDRLDLTVDSLQSSRLGKVLVKVVKDPPRAAAKDVASGIEAKWRKLIADKNKASPPPDSAGKKKIEEDRSKKRKPLELPASKTAPPSKKPATAPATATKPVVVKKEADKAVKKDAKTDSSFFSSKPKAKLPSFRKVSTTVPVKKEETDPSVAQPSSIDPFQEALKSMGKSNNIVDRSAESTPLSDVAGLPPKLGKNGKPKKTVSFAAADKLEMVKLIEKAVYDDDVGEGAHHASYRDLDRDEGHALHSHIFEEQLDWYEPPVVDIPDSLPRIVKGSESLEMGIQEEREKSALMAAYMSNAQIPDTPSESIANMDALPVDESQMAIMLPGADVARLDVQQIQSVQPTLKDLLAKISLPVLGQTMSEPFPQQPPTQPRNHPTPPAGGEYGMDIDGYQNYNQSEDMAWSGGSQTDTYGQYGSGASGDPGWSGLPQGSGYQEEWEDDREPRGARRRDGGWPSRGRGGASRGRFNAKRIPCTFFQEGRCRHGDNCNFLHEYV